MAQNLDMVLDHGARGTKAALSLFSAPPVFSDRLCSLCAQPIEQDSSYLEHLVESHSELQLETMEVITEALVSASPALIQSGKRLLSYSPPSNLISVMLHNNVYFCFCLFFYFTFTCSIVLQNFKV